MSLRDCGLNITLNMQNSCHDDEISVLACNRMEGCRQGDYAIDLVLITKL